MCCKRMKWKENWLAVHMVLLVRSEKIEHKENHSNNNEKTANQTDFPLFPSLISNCYKRMLFLKLHNSNVNRYNDGKWAEKDEHRQVQKDNKIIERCL